MKIRKIWTLASFLLNRTWNTTWDHTTGFNVTTFCLQIRPLTYIYISNPPVKHNEIHFFSIKKECVSQMFTEAPELQEKLEEYKSRVVESEALFPNEIMQPMEPHMDYPQVVFLGTGSAVQTKYRNVSGEKSFLVEFRL